MERRILIIDDEKRMADSLRDLLRAEGWRAETAYRGEEGLERLAREEFPVVVTDLRMGAVGGLDVVRTVRERHPKTLVVVVTGYASADSAIDALHNHAFDYLRKPYEFAELKRSLDRAFHKLEVDQLREDTAAMITHDVKAPLQSIAGFAAMMIDRETGRLHERAAEYAETIRRASDRALALVENFLASHKADTGALTAFPRPHPVAALFDDLVALYGAEARFHGFAIERRLPEPEDARVRIDEPLVFRAAANLLQNAIKYGDPAEPIVLEAERTVLGDSGGADSADGKRAVRIGVSNRAPGLTEECLEGIFGRFSRSSLATGIEGSGIGLYVVDAVARAHGGLARARREGEDRVVFEIVVPEE